jgi:hypothetical protein
MEFGSPDLSPTLLLVACQAIGCLFLLASLAKLSDRSAAVEAVKAYKILNAATARLFGLSLPWVELFVALSLIATTMVPIGLVVALILLTFFTAAQTLSLSKGRVIPCGCFGSASSQVVTWRRILFNLALAAGCAGILLLCLRTGLATALNRTHMVARLLAPPLVSIVAFQIMSITQAIENARLERGGRLRYPELFIY